jgi:hypothetical protein
MPRKVTPSCTCWLNTRHVPSTEREQYVDGYENGILCLGRRARLRTQNEKPDCRVVVLCHTLCVQSLTVTFATMLPGVLVLASAWGETIGNTCIPRGKKMTNGARLEEFKIQHPGAFDLYSVRISPRPYDYTRRKMGKWEMLKCCVLLRRTSGSQRKEVS